MSSLVSSSSDFRSQALAALNACARGQIACRTDKAIAGRATDPQASRPYYVSPTHGLTTWHESAPLAVARLATL